MDAKTAEQKPEKVQYRAVKTRLREVLKETWNLYTKNFLGFTGLFVLPVILSFALRLGVFSMFGFNAVTGQANSLNFGMVVAGFLIVIILGWLIQLLGVTTTLRGSHLADTTGKLPFAEAFREGLGKLGKAAGLSIRVFFYTGVWIIMVMAVVMALGALSTFLAAQMPDNESLKIFAPLAGIVGIIPLVMLVVLLFLIKRICNAVFSFPILMSKEVTGKEALDESIALADGITGTIFANYFLFGLLIAILGGILTQLFMQLIGVVYPSPEGAMDARIQYIQNVSDYASIIPGMIIGSFSIVFQYAFMKKAREEKKDQGGMATETVETEITQPKGPVLS